MEQRINTANGFSDLWKVNSETTYINGDDHIPDIHHRQRNLIGKVLNACIVLHINGQIEIGASLTSISNFLPNMSSADFEALANMDKNERLEKLVKMVKSRDPQLKTHRDLTDHKEWEEYKNNFDIYLLEKDQWINRQNEQKWENDEYTHPPEMPEDPRIKAINDEIRPTIHILNSGAKTPASIDRKRKDNEKKNDTEIPISRIKDMNRVKVLPTSPEYAADFIQIMKLFNQEKTIGSDSIPRFFEEPAEIKKNGFYNQKLFIALDGNKKRGGFTEGNLGTIAEIQIVPAAMERAERLSAPIREVSRELDVLSQYANDDSSPPNHEMLTKRGLLKRLFDQQKAKFEKLKDHYNVEEDYHFPDFPKTKLDAPQTYQKFREKLFELAIPVHTDAIIHSQQWHAPYLRTAILQNIAVADPRNLQKINEKLPSDLPHHEAIALKSLKKIVETGDWNITSLTKKIKDEFDLSPSSKQR